jgi:hypothetical protein
LNKNESFLESAAVAAVVAAEEIGKTNGLEKEQTRKQKVVFFPSEQFIVRHPVEFLLQSYDQEN